MATTLPVDLAEKLGDLGKFGIHLTNQVGICHKCGRETKPYSSGYSLDAFCESCDRQETPNGRPYAAFSPATVWVVKGLDKLYARERYEAIVKIDGRLYTARSGSGSGYSLFDLETGEVAERRGLDELRDHLLKLWYLDQGDTTIHAHVVQLLWYPMKEEVAAEMHYHANWVGGSIPIYDLGHNGRGWEEEGYVYVRLYLRLKEPTMVNRDDFELIDVQLVKEADAPFLDGYEVAKFPGKVVNLKWSQAGPAFLRALLSIRADWEINPSPWLRESEDADGRTRMERAVDGVREHYRAMAARHSMPTDAWITLIVSYDRHHGQPDEVIRHQLDHLIVHPF